MKKKLDAMTLLLENNNINIRKGARQRENHDWNTQLERGHAPMENVSKPRALLIDSGASNHMVASKESFSFMYFDGIIPIHMGDESNHFERKRYCKT